MALPVGLIVGAAEAARNPLVRETAVRIFGWLSQKRSVQQSEALAAKDPAELLAELPTRAELALALSQVDVRIAQAERRMVQRLGGGLVAATVLLSAVILID